jgi:hypothetical protein
MGHAVWAEAYDVPGLVCADARLYAGAGTSVQYPQGTLQGQAGWDTGLQFSDLTDLAKQLAARFRRGEVFRLGIHVHGLAGQFFPAGRSRPDLAVTSATVQRYHPILHEIGLRTSEAATILILGCLAGQGTEGSRLLEGLSKIWRGRRVVGFTTLGYAWGGEQNRPGEKCSEPGMRDTNETSPLLSTKVEAEVQKQWKDLRQLPWSSETSPHAKLALNGKVRKGPPEAAEKKIEERPIFMNKQLHDKWKEWKALAAQPHRGPAEAKRQDDLSREYTALKRKLEQEHNVKYVEPK